MNSILGLQKQAFTATLPAPNVPTIVQSRLPLLTDWPVQTQPPPPKKVNIQDDNIAIPSTSYGRKDEGGWPPPGNFAEDEDNAHDDVPCVLIDHLEDLSSRILSELPSLNP